MRKLNNDQKCMAARWKTTRQKTRNRHMHICGTIISFIHESIHVIHRLGAARLGAVWR